MRSSSKAADVIFQLFIYECPTLVARGEMNDLYWLLWGKTFHEKAILFNLEFMISAPTRVLYMCNQRVTLNLYIFKCKWGGNKFF